MEEPVRVLNVTRTFQAAGIESFIMNIYRHIDRTRVQFDFMVMSAGAVCYDDEIKLLGGKKYTISVSRKNSLLQILEESKKLYAFLKGHNYQIIHIHYTTPLRAPYLLAAKKAGVPVRIYHSHSAEVLGKSKFKLFVYNLFRKKIAGWGTDWLACSKTAGDWMFTDSLIKEGKVKIIYNGIDCERFKLKEDIRNKVRNQLRIENDYVIIHTGRFLDQKNHKFVIRLFDELRSQKNNVKLLLLGTGELLDAVKTEVNSRGLEEDVFFLGVRTDVERYLCAADCFIMPSLYEGLPVAAIEAQCAGLPCVFSENITREVALRENVSFLSLNMPVEEWCRVILDYKDNVRTDGSYEVMTKGYDVRGSAALLEEIYLTEGE